MREFSGGTARLFSGLRVRLGETEREPGWSCTALLPLYYLPPLRPICVTSYVFLLINWHSNLFSLATGPQSDTEACKLKELCNRVGIMGENGSLWLLVVRCFWAFSHGRTEEGGGDCGGYSIKFCIQVSSKRNRISSCAKIMHLWIHTNSKTMFAGSNEKKPNRRFSCLTLLEG